MQDLRRSQFEHYTQAEAQAADADASAHQITKQRSRLSSIKIATQQQTSSNCTQLLWNSVKSHAVKIATQQETSSNCTQLLRNSVKSHAVGSPASSSFGRPLLSKRYPQIALNFYGIP